MIAAPTMRTFADLQAKLGGVPAHRILLHPTPGTATEADLLHHLDGDDKRLVELVDGTLVEKPMGQKESFLGLYLGGLMTAHAVLHDLAWVSGMDAASRMRAGNIRLPDISVFPWSMFPDRMMDDEKIASYCPQLGVEILSESNTVAEIDGKLHEYFTSGMKVAWIIDPETRTAKVHTAPKRFRMLQACDSLSGGTILPGFTMDLSQLFAVGEHRRKKR